MSTTTRLMPYPEDRALEHTMFAVDAVPTRIHRVLLPVWCVEVEADVTEGKPYELIDRYLERGIAEAGLGTAEELASFFALEPPVVGQALRFLAGIGHLVEHDGRLVLTELGYRSVRDKVRYVHTRRDRRKLYFDAFTCRPLTRGYYDVRKVAFLTGGPEGMPDRREGPSFHALSSMRGFRREALAELAGHPDRDRYNLPERIDNPRSLDEECQVFLPAYLVRAVERGGRVRYLAYTPAGDTADEDLSAACEETPWVMNALEAEDAVARREDFEVQAGRWLSAKGLARHRPVRAGNGAWRVTLPGDCFGADAALRFTKLGSFVVLRTGFFQVWCKDTRVRKHALVMRLDSYLGSRVRADRDDVRERIDQFARQLDLGAVGIAELRRAAVQAGRRSLADQLARLAADGD
ncbi:hypothetical protein GCM10027168_62770 [Streptomyces capparidis]